MGILRSIESRLERVVEGSVGRLFRASVAPVELARKLAKELEEGKVVSVTQTYAPNEYTIYLSPRDRTRFADFEASLRNELASYLAEHARRAGYVMPTRPRVRFETETSLHTGIFGISTALVRDDEEPLDALAVPPVGEAPSAAPAADPFGAPPVADPFAVPPVADPYPAPLASAPPEAVPQPPADPDALLPETALGVPSVPEAPPEEPLRSPLDPDPAAPPPVPPLEPEVESEPVHPSFMPPLPDVGRLPDVPLPSEGVPSVPTPAVPPAPPVPPVPFPDLPSLPELPSHDPDVPPRPPIADAPPPVPVPMSFDPPLDATMITRPEPREELVIVHDGRRTPIEGAVVQIGRAPSCEIVLDDRNVSRRHAEIRRRGPVVVLIDLDSTNGTIVNGRRVREHPLADGDRITLGNSRLTFERRTT